MGVPRPSQMEPSISCVITTTRPWPEVATALASVYLQTLEAGGEVILADGTGRGLPSEHEFTQVRHLVSLGANVFVLRSLGLRAGRAPVVALTEDHCRVADDWVIAVLRAHAEHPEAALIGGAVLNGACDRLLDWANFLASNAACLPPLDVRRGPNVTGQANVSYKRHYLERYPDDALFEGRFRRELDRAGVRLIADERIRVEHVQTLRVAETLRLHFHDGRCVTGARRVDSPWGTRLGDLAKGLSWPVRVPVATARVVTRILLRKPAYRLVALASAPWLFGVMAFHKAGELVGAIAGPGLSPGRMR
jgi:hypothetical protein